MPIMIEYTYSRMDRRRNRLTRCLGPKCLFGSIYHWSGALCAAILAIVELTPGSETSLLRSASRNAWIEVRNGPEWKWRSGLESGCAINAEVEDCVY